MRICFAFAAALLLSAAVPAAAHRVAPSLVSDVTLSRPAANRRFALSVSVHNLFDTAYGDPASEEHRQQVIPQDGRTAALRLTWHLR